jgi:riboflavin kinase/FMN adenylyltransferase
VDDTRYAAAVNVGPNPTFGDSADKVECHLIGFQGSLYGRVLEVDFLRRLRTIRTFSSAEELQRQLARDVAEAAADFA